jgi:phytoene synthase
VSDPTSTPASSPDEDISRVTARAWERDRYLAALLAPSTVREDLITLAAFAGEIARIPAYVSEPMMGEIRLQWWRDALSAESGSGHPIADRMRAVIARYSLPEFLVVGFIDAQAFGLQDEPIADEQMLTAQLAKTEGALFELALRILGRSDAAARATALAAGKAYGLARMLVELPALWAQGRSLIPASRLADAGVSVDDWKSGISEEGIRPILAAIAADARRQLDVARRHARDLSRAQLVALLPIAVVEPYLQALGRHGRDPIRDPIDVAPLRRVWRIWRAHWTGRF